MSLRLIQKLAINQCIKDHHSPIHKKRFRCPIGIRHFIPRSVTQDVTDFGGLAKIIKKTIEILNRGVGVLTNGFPKRVDETP